MFRLHLSLALALLLLLCGHSPAADRLAVGEEWSLERIWKDAREGYHFYKGKLPLRNVSDASAENVRARARLLALDGREISASNWLDYGTIGSGRQEVREFRIDRAVQFAELVVEVSYRAGGAEAQERFSTDGTRKPESLTIDPAGSVLELRLLACDIDRTSKKHHTLTARVRNLASVPAEAPVLTIDYKIGAAERKKIERKLAKSGQQDPAKGPAWTMTDGGKLRAVVNADPKPIASGETRNLVVKLDPIEFDGFQVKVAARWPKAETVIEETITETVETLEGEGPIMFGVVRPVQDASGKPQLQTKVKSTVDLKEKQLVVTVNLSDKGRPVETVRYVVPTPLKAGQEVTLRIPRSSGTDYDTYDIAFEF